MRYVLSLVLPVFVAATISVLVSHPSKAVTTTVSPKFEPPDGSIMSGVDADQQPGDTVEVAKARWDEWTKLMGGKRTNISHTFEGFDTWFGYDYDVANVRGAMPLISWQTGSTAPKTIAQAGNTSSGKPTDQIILQNAKLSVDYGKPAFLRVDQEMNAHWFQWSSYNGDGTRRPSGPEDFRNMWRRMAIIFDGGKVADVNAKLAAAGMPPLDADAKFPTWMNMPSTTDPNGYVQPASNVAFVFNPVDAPGIPDVAGNRWADYYPGDEYVDWVGQTSYNVTWNATMEQRFKWLSAFYEEFSVRRGKPYMLGEWGVAPKAGSGFGDNPAYVNDVLRWAKARSKVKAMVYFGVNQANGDDLRLSSYPESAKALAAALQPDGYLNAPTPAPAPAPAPPPNTAPAPNTAPSIFSPRPARGSTTRDLTPTVSVAARDAQTNLAKSNLALYVDGRRVTNFYYNSATDRLSYTPRTKLRVARHTVKVVARDAQGLSTTYTWHFRVA